MAAIDNKNRSEQFDFENFDCLTCGACCQHHRSVGVRKDDVNFGFLLGGGYIAESEEDGEFGMRSGDNRRCIALEGAVGEAVSCSIYENRPAACRSYVAGAGQCELARIFTFISRKKPE